RIPGDLLRAYTAVELEGLAAGNPSGIPSARQKREARANAKDKLESEAEDGRFLKRKAIPVLWDRQANEFLVASNSTTILDRLYTLFYNTFERKLEPLYAGAQAFRLAEVRQQSRNVDDAGLSTFVPGIYPSEVAWSPDEANRDFVGNEFLLWLWYFVETESDT